jgi:Ca2+-binding EF-hand superfamily protein
VINVSGTIDLREFLLTMLAFRPSNLASVDDTIRLYFNVFDLDQSGFISREELDVAVLCAAFPSASAAAAPHVSPAQSGNGSDKSRSHMSMRRRESFQDIVGNASELFQVINVSGTGHISYEEFEQFYKSIMAAGSVDNISR